MVVNYKNIIGIAPTLQAASLAANTAKKATKKDAGLGDIVGSATGILVGVPLIKTQFDLIGSL